MQSLEKILKTEDKCDFEKAFNLYNELFEKDKADFEIWKHFYFFLWIAIEETSSDFHEKINLRQRLKLMFEEGKNKFKDNAKFNFITGYTVSIFPYEYGNYDNLEKQGKEMLKKAAVSEPNNKIYRMVYLGSLTNYNKDELRKAEIEASPIVTKKYNGPGLMNRYFRQVLNRAK